MMRATHGIGLAAVLLLLGACQRSDEPAPAAGTLATSSPPAADPGPVQEMLDYRLTETTRGVARPASSR